MQAQSTRSPFLAPESWARASRSSSLAAAFVSTSSTARPRRSPVPAAGTRARSTWAISTAPTRRSSTARRMVPGGLAFAPLISELIGADIATALDARRRSLPRPSRLGRRCRSAGRRSPASSALVREHPPAAATSPTSPARRSRSAAGTRPLADPATIVAGFARPSDRSTPAGSPTGFATRSPPSRGSPSVPASPSLGAAPIGATDGRWRVRARRTSTNLRPRRQRPLERPARDRSDSGARQPDAAWSNRYRLVALRPHRKARRWPLCGGRRRPLRRRQGLWRPPLLSLLVSGRPARRSRTRSRSPGRRQPCRKPNASGIVAEVRAGLAGVLPWTGEILDAAEAIRVEGGFVFAQGQGALSDPRSTLHRRDRFGVRRRGHYSRSTPANTRPPRPSPRTWPGRSPEHDAREAA